ncbi:MAG: phosphatase PAP2 family protein [Candidatus Pacearchaeota archaeon]|jgi:undecaprenyl-diphosphatase
MIKKRDYFLIISILSLILFIILTYSINSIKIDSFDIIVNKEISTFRFSLLNEAMLQISDLISPIALLVFLITLWILLSYKKRIKDFLMIVSGIVLGSILNFLIKDIIERPRPENYIKYFSDYSYPSAHSQMAMIFFFLLAYTFSKKLNKKLKKIFISLNIFIILLVGFSRIYLGAHWPTDVLGGYLVGLFLANLLIYLSTLIKHE